MIGFVPGHPLPIAFPMLSADNPSTFLSGLDVDVAAWAKSGTDPWESLAGLGDVSEIGTSGVYELTLEPESTAGVDQILVKATAPTAVETAMMFVDELSPLSGTVSAIAGKLAGISKLAGWLRLLARSDSAVGQDEAASLAEINADMGSGPGDFANHIASLEAVLDRGNAAWKGGYNTADMLQIIAGIKAVAPHIKKATAGKYTLRAGDFWSQDISIAVPDDANLVLMLKPSGLNLTEDNDSVLVISTASGLERLNGEPYATGNHATLSSDGTKINFTVSSAANIKIREGLYQVSVKVLAQGADRTVEDQAELTVEAPAIQRVTD